MLFDTLDSRTVWKKLAWRSSMQNQCDLRFQRKASQCFSGYAGRACAELLGHAPELLWVPWSVISDRSCHSVMLSDLKQFAVESVLFNVGSRKVCNVH